MDARLVQRFRQGDVEAARDVEHELRRVAHLVLGVGGFGVDPSARAVLATAAAADAIERGGREPDSLGAAVILAAARRAVEHQRSRDEAQEGHLPAGILVSAALVPQAMAGPARASAEEHLAACATCTDEVRRVREASASAVEALGGGPRTEAPAAAPRVPVEALLEDGPSLRSVARRTLTALRTPAAPRARAGGGPRSVRRTRRKAKPRGPWVGLLASGLVVVVMVGLMVGRCQLGVHDPEATPASVTALAHLAVPVVPEVPPRDQWDPSSTDAWLDLAAGQCLKAATRFRKARGEDPEGVMAYWEGLAALCAGQAQEAWQALEAAAEAPQAPSLADLDWYRAQAAIRLGRADLARERAEQACARIGGFQETACAIAAELARR